MLEILIIQRYTDTKYRKQEGTFSPVYTNSLKNEKLQHASDRLLIAWIYGVQRFYLFYLFKNS